MVTNKGGMIMADQKIINTQAAQTQHAVALELMRAIMSYEKETLWEKNLILDLYRECLWCTRNIKQPDHT